MKKYIIFIIVSIGIGLLILFFVNSIYYNKRCIEQAEIFYDPTGNTEPFKVNIYNCFENLLDYNKSEIFIKLSNTENAVSKAYGFWGIYLTAQTKKEKMHILKKSLQNTTPIKVKGYGIISMSNIGLLCLDLVFSSLTCDEKKEIIDFIYNNKMLHLSNYPKLKACE